MNTGTDQITDGAILPGGVPGTRRAVFIAWKVIHRNEDRRNDGLEGWWVEVTVNRKDGVSE
jgi:hypothetical protein